MFFYSEMGYSKGCTAFFSSFWQTFQPVFFFAGNVLHQLTEEKRLDKIQMSGEVRPEKADGIEPCLVTGFFICL